MTCSGTALLFFLLYYLAVIAGTVEKKKLKRKIIDSGLKKIAAKKSPIFSY
jgi:hypothetical protein